jgi:hypothetical protein
MKKIKAISVVILTATLVLTSCGGSKSSKSVEDKKDSISTLTESDSVTSSTSNENVTSNKSENMDVLLKNYETFIDQYIVLLKKAKKGDATALADYPAIMKSATDLQTKLGTAENNMSVSQMQKFVDLQGKLVKAASEIQ